MSIRSRVLHGLYAITDPGAASVTPLAEAVAAAIRGGARLVQYRNKTGDAARRLCEAQALLAVCREHEVPLIINDDVDLAVRIGADGVHLGREDAPLDEARACAGPRAILGVSCYDSLERALVAEQAGADYVAFGSFFASPSKPRAVRAPLELLRTAHQRLNVPCCAIGGITPDNGAALVAAGADMLAVISGLFASADIESAARRYARLFL